MSANSYHKERSHVARGKVTANVHECPNVLKEAVQALPPGDIKAKAQGVPDYLDRTSQGEKQPLRGAECPVEKLIIN